MVRAMDSPMPMPSALLVKNGSKTSFSLSSGMPWPRSDADSSAKFSNARSPDADDAIFARRILHRVDPVHDKVQNDLLKLNVVAEDRKRIRCDQTHQFGLSCGSLRRKESGGFLNDVVEVEAFQFERCLCQEAPHPPDDFAGPSVIPHDIVHYPVQFRDVRA